MTILPIVVSWFLTLGYVPEMHEHISNPIDTNIYMKQATMAQIGLSFETQDNRFKVYTDIKNYQYAKSLVSFSPFRIDYSIGAQFNVNNSLHLNIDHECMHPVMSHSVIDYPYGSGITTLSLTLKGSTR